jgi:hypothetical protein
MSPNQKATGRALSTTPASNISQCKVTVFGENDKYELAGMADDDDENYCWHKDKMHCKWKWK